MSWTPLFLRMDDKKVFILGSGEVGIRRALRFRESGAEVVICGDRIPTGLKKIGVFYCPLDEMEEWIKWADIVIIASGDPRLNEKATSLASGKLLNRADNPEKGDLIVPTTFSIDDVDIAIFTRGKSPLMARFLREKIESLITENEILNIKLQDYARRKLKKIIPDQKIRRRILYELSEDSEVQRNLKNGDLKGAKKHVDSLLDSLRGDFVDTQHESRS